MTKIIGCDFHPRFQQIAFVERETGEFGERRLSHPDEAERYYRSLAGQGARIGVEATGNYRWFLRLMQELGHEVLIGDATQIRASNPRKQKTDKRDARHILTLLVEDRFPAVWQPPLENEEQRYLLLHRCRLVQMRTRVKNQLDSIHPTDEDLSVGAPAIAKNEGWLSPRVWGAKRREQMEGLALTGWRAERRRDLLALLEELDGRIGPLDEAVRRAAEANSEARLLMTHPGVGPMVSLAYVLVIGDWRRFPRGKQVGSYLHPSDEDLSPGPPAWG